MHQRRAPSRVQLCEFRVACNRDAIEVNIAVIEITIQLQSAAGQVKIVLSMASDVHDIARHVDGEAPRERVALSNGNHLVTHAGCGLEGVLRCGLEGVLRRGLEGVPRCGAGGVAEVGATGWAKGGFCGAAGAGGVAGVVATGWEGRGSGAAVHSHSCSRDRHGCRREP